MAFGRQGSGTSSRPHERVGGFTLVELMVTVAVLAILVTLAAPSFQEMTNRNNVVSGTNEMIALLQGARMEAVRLNSRVEVCPSSDGSACSGSNDWTQVVMRDADANVLRHVELNSRLTARGSGNVNNKIIFHPDGLARQGSSPSTILNGVLEVCINSARPKENARHISVSGARVSVEAPVTSSNCEAMVPNS